MIRPVAQALARTLAAREVTNMTDFLIGIPYIHFQASLPVSYEVSIKSKRQEEFVHIYFLSVSLYNTHLFTASLSLPPLL